MDATYRNFDISDTCGLDHWFKHTQRSLIETLFVSPKHQPHGGKHSASKHRFFLGWFAQTRKHVAHKTNPTTERIVTI